MKKYPNINKYLNRTPRGYLLFLLIGHIFVWGGLFLWFLQEPELRIIDKLLFLAFVVGTTLEGSRPVYINEDGIHTIDWLKRKVD